MAHTTPPARSQSPGYHFASSQRDAMINEGKADRAQAQSERMKGQPFNAKA